MVAAKFNDFEVNPRGYAEEIRLSRDLVNKLLYHHEFTDLNSEVVSALQKLTTLYERQRDEGIQ